MQHLLSANFFCDAFPLYVAEARHGMVETHRHDFFELVYVISGAGMHRNRLLHLSHPYRRCVCDQSR